MESKKIIIELMDDFSKKISTTNESQNIILKATHSSIQEKINDRESERKEFLRKQMKNFFEPQTKDIEEDEESLLKAYTLFCKIKEIHKENGDNRTHLKAFSIVSPLCAKAEYISGVQNQFKTNVATEKNPVKESLQPAKVKSDFFCFLRLWFLETNPEAEFIPVMEADFSSNINQNTELKKIDSKDFYESFSLSFIEKELWKPSGFEKEIIQVANDSFTNNLKNFL